MYAPRRARGRDLSPFVPLAWVSAARLRRPVVIAMAFYPLDAQQRAAPRSLGAARAGHGHGSPAKRYSSGEVLAMTRRALLRRSFLRARGRAAFARRSRPRRRRTRVILFRPTQHKTSDQQAAILYARELIAAGRLDAAVTQLAGVRRDRIPRRPKRLASWATSTTARGASTRPKRSISQLLARNLAR